MNDMLLSWVFHWTRESRCRIGLHDCWALSIAWVKRYDVTSRMPIHVRICIISDGPRSQSVATKHVSSCYHSNTFIYILDKSLSPILSMSCSFPVSFAKLCCCFLFFQKTPRCNLKFIILYVEYFDIPLVSGMPKVLNVKSYHITC